MKYNKKYLHNMYNATSTEHPQGSDKLETYEHWLERQLIARIKRIEILEAAERSSVAENEQVKEKCSNCDSENIIKGQAHYCKDCNTCDVNMCKQF